MSKSRKYVVLKGGLGNQLFQINFGLFLESSFESDVLFVDFVSATDSHRSFDLKLESKPLGQFTGNLVKLYANIARKHIREAFHEQYRTVQRDLDEGVFFTGYWQSKNYLTSESISYVRSVVGSVPAFENGICAVHIRGGDYLTVDSAKNFHGLQSVEYYSSAVNHMISKGCVVFDIYTDSIEYVEKQIIPFLPPADYRVVTGNEPKVDMAEIAAHSGIICSNSTFSLWSAILCSDHSKVVVPKQWLTNTALSMLEISLPELHKELFFDKFFVL